MSVKSITNDKGDVIISDPPIAHLLFSTTRFAWLWAIVRLYLGYQWLNAGYHKAAGTGWLDGGASLKGFWTNAVTVPESGKAVVAFSWYRSFLQFLLDTGSYTWFAKLVVASEFLIGIALVLGAFVGIAAFFGAFMNWNFIMAGTASSNGLLLVISVVLILAWKVAGWYGLDRYLLPLIGVPWHGKEPELPTKPNKTPAKAV